MAEQVGAVRDEVWEALEPLLPECAAADNRAAPRPGPGGVSEPL